MIIRTATLADTESIAPLLGELDYPSTPEEVSRRLTALGNAPETAAFVAEEDGQVVGVANVQRLHVLHSDSGFTQLLLLAIAPGAQRRGVGRALVGAAEAWAREHGCTRMLVVSGEERADAHAFYEALGFHHIARRYIKRIG